MIFPRSFRRRVCVSQINKKYADVEMVDEDEEDGGLVISSTSEFVRNLGI